jgi:hypothetical protein
MAEGQKEIDARRAASKSSADLFGTRESLKNYVNRAVGRKPAKHSRAVHRKLTRPTMPANRDQDPDHLPFVRGAPIC